MDFFENETRPERALLVELDTGEFDAQTSLDELYELVRSAGAADGEELGKRIRSILDRSGQPSTLKEWGVKREDLPRMASLGLTKGRADNNPLDIDEATILEILEEIYD